MATFPPPSSPTAQAEAEIEIVDLRGGYPIDDEELFSLANLAAAHLTALGYRANAPRDKSDAGRMLLLVNDLFEVYEDIECAMVGNADESRGYSYFLSTSAGRTADLSLAEYDALIRTQDFWHPPEKFHMCETSVDREVKSVLEAKGIHVRPFRTVFWG
ncbi:uncharacterized protein SCHCODRAFT_02617821 [Schizophyllum commune H4-8]|uniref:uncharacterized protein n=1 Tax=Schizophyllum commune (strain H4-8 / FGSC 9210) TaxID=578458 RepID=UPI00215EC46B|nr:uncharacterized protein SCHCODRAFT_02617821 [Schizophyllum commune H4-8]KAI5894799.1 hypothetical protein SCHCODRAFT_02617821 [Schizophyllum commune H4-8]